MENLLSGQLPFFILMFVVVYFFMIRPSIQKQKKEKRFGEALKKGDKVITKSGLHAKILEINEDGTLILESGAGKMKFEKAALSMELSSKINETTEKK